MLGGLVPERDFLRAEFAARNADELLNPLLIWDQIFPVVTVDAQSFTYTVKSASGTRYSDSSDPRKETAPPRTPGSEFPGVTISSFERKSGSLTEYGFKFDLSPDILRFSAGIDELDRHRSTVAFWSAEQMNQLVLDGILGVADNSGTEWLVNTDSTKMEDIMEQSGDYGTHAKGYLTGTLDTGFYWDDGANANPVETIMEWATVFRDQDGYNRRLTDVWMDVREFLWFKKYLINNSHTWEMSPLTGEILVPRIGNVAIHELTDVAGLPDADGVGIIIGTDRNNPAGRTYQAFSPRFPRGEKVSVHNFTDDKTHMFTEQYFWTRASVLQEPNAIGVLRVRA